MMTRVVAFTFVSLLLGLGKVAAKPLEGMVAESPVLTAKKEPRLVSVSADLSGARELYLVVSDEGDKNCDWANWLQPKLRMKDGTLRALSELDWLEATSGAGQVRQGKNHSGGDLTVEGQVYAEGIGTHAPSVITYTLPEGVVGFESLVAIDDGGMIRSGQPSSARIRFRVFTQKPPVTASQFYDPDGPKLVPPERFKVPEGFEVTVWATWPMINNPTNIDFDADGRLYVAEGVNYRGKGKRQPEGDRIVILEDRSGAGRADQSRVFVQEPALAAPLGVAVFGNRVVVSQAPDLLVYTDVNGDGHFSPELDRREVLLTGFRGVQHDHSLHSVTAGPNGQWYWNQGNTGAEFTDRSGKTFRMGSPYMLQEIAGHRSDDGHVWIGGFAARMNPDGSEVAIVGHNFRNSYEQVMSSYGDLFQSDNDDPPACRVSRVIEGGNAGFASADGQRSWSADRRPGQETATAEWRQEDPGTMPAGDVYGGGSPTGVAYYENGALGEEWEGLLLACEAGKNVVYGYFPVPEGAGYKLERFDFMTSNPEQEWAGSDFLGGNPTGDLKTMFRPSDVAVGPDGAIYVADWFDARVGGHGTLDEGSSGTIYRIAPKGFRSRIPRIDLNTIEGAIEALKSPAINVRHGGFVRLREEGAAAIPAVSALLKERNTHLVARAVWLLAQLGPEGVAEVVPLLRSDDAMLRLVAYRALRFVDHDPAMMARAMATDSSPMIRAEAALMMRDRPVAESREILLTVARGFDGRDRSYLESFGLGCEGKEAELYAALAEEWGAPAAQWSEAFSWLAWRLHPAAAAGDFRLRAELASLPEEERKRMLTALAFVKSPEAAGHMIELALAPEFPFRELAKWWLMNRKSNDWRSYGIDEAMKARGLYDPSKITITSVEMPPVVSDAAAIPPTEVLRSLRGDPEKGQVAAAACYTCHKIGEAGVDFGPDLSSFGRQQALEVILEAIARPSSEISHGYEGSRIIVDEETIVTGMVLSSGDPIIVKCVGGLIQTIPRERVKSIEPLGRSLMYDPATLGLSPEMIADIAAYLKSL